MTRTRAPAASFLQLNQAAQAVDEHPTLRPGDFEKTTGESVVGKIARCERHDPVVLDVFATSPNAPECSESIELNARRTTPAILSARRLQPPMARLMPPGSGTVPATLNCANSCQG
jgi:hypothetical protein